LTVRNQEEVRRGTEAIKRPMLRGSDLYANNDEGMKRLADS
jgi:hypothetical protein